MLAFVHISGCDENKPVPCPKVYSPTLAMPMKDLFGGLFKTEFTYLFCKLFLFTK